MSRWVLRAALAIAEALFSTPNGPPAKARMDWLAADLGDFLRQVGGRSRFLLGLSALIVAVLAPLLVLRFVPLWRLPLPERVRALATLERHFGEPLLAVKAILCILYYEHPDAAREIGFDGECRQPRAIRGEAAP